MKFLPRRLAVLLVLSTIALVVPSPVQATIVENFHLHVTGVARIGTSTCSFDVPPAPETECLDTTVFLVKEGRPYDQLRKQPWIVGVIEGRYVFHSLEEPVTVLHERFGLLEAPSAFIDARLSAAAVSASVPMDDGSTYVLDLAWDMSDVPFHVSGNDGPIVEPGVPWGSHLVGECTTGNWHAHEAWRIGGRVTGSLDGTNVDSLFLSPDTPFVARGVFTITISAHGPSCT